MESVEMVVDMQGFYLKKSFHTDQLIENICQRLEIAMCSNDPILLVEYWLSGATHPRIQRTLEGYPYQWTLVKDEGGLLDASDEYRSYSLEILEKFERDRAIRLSWVNALQCVLQTWKSLRRYGFSAKVALSHIADMTDVTMFRENNLCAKILNGYKRRWAINLIDPLEIPAWVNPFKDRRPLWDVIAQTKSDSDSIINPFVRRKQVWSNMLEAPKRMIRLVT